MLAILINIIGSVALLIWGMFMIRTGMLRTFGDALRSWLAKYLTNRFCGFGAGFVVSTLLQSSTASALLVSGLQSKGLVTTATALSSVLGADLGSAFMVRVLSLDIRAAAPVLITVGAFLYLKFSRVRAGQFGRILVGLAFVMMALGGIVTVTEPLKNSAETAALFSFLSNSPVFATGLGVLLAFACYSSLAVVVITSTFVAGGVLPVSVALWVVLGANLGSAFLASITTIGGNAVARLAPTGNCVFRVAGFLIGAAALLLCPWIGNLFGNQGPDGVIYFHLGFNAVLGALGLLFIGPVSSFVEERLHVQKTQQDSEVRLLSAEALETPSNALRLTAQEIGTTVNLLIQYWMNILPLITTNPESGEILLLTDKQNLFDRRSHAVGKYLIALMQTTLTHTEAERWQILQNANSNALSISQTMTQIVRRIEKKKCRKNRFFSAEGQSELIKQHERVSHNLLLLSQYFGNESEVDRHRAYFVLGKERLSLTRDEFDLIERHMNRVAMRAPLSVETSALHIELLSLFHKLNMLICSSTRAV